MQPTKKQFRIRGIAIAACVSGTLMAQTVAAAPCPPGYYGSYPHCMPDQAKPHPAYTAHSYAHAPGATMHTSRPHTFAPKMIDRSKVKPQPGVPIEHRSGASERHGIIFVGGHSSSNLDKAALNPQPIPPGHTVKKLPHHGAPVEQPAGH